MQLTVGTENSKIGVNNNNYIYIYTIYVCSVILYNIITIL